jgi:hypothetical protein
MKEEIAISKIIGTFRLQNYAVKSYMKKLFVIIFYLLFFNSSYSQWVYQNCYDSIPNISSGLFINSNTGWYARANGWISKTTNGGLYWNTYKINVNDLNSIKFINENTDYVCGNNGRLMKSIDGGISFVAVNTQSIPDKYSLSQNYPNPFNPNTTIKFQKKESKLITLKVCNILGKEVATLVNEKLGAGEYKVQFPEGLQLSSGIYFYSLFVDGLRIDTKKNDFVKIKYIFTTVGV